MTRLPRRIAALVALVWMLCLVSPPAVAAEVVAFTWRDQRLAAPVGLAADRDHGVYWAANAGSGSTTSVFAVDASGQVKARLSFAVATRGPEAVAYDAGRVFVADVGATRGKVTVSYATVPRVEDATVTFRAWDFSYPDATETTRALVVGPNTQLHLVTSAGRVYAAPAAPTAQGMNQLTKVADVGPGIVGGTADASGIVLRTASEVLALDRTFRVVARQAAPAQQSPRGIARALDGSGLLLSGQGVGSSVLAIPTPAPPASPAPVTPSATASASPSAQATRVPSGQGASRTGTFIALGGALAVALAAAMAAFARR